MKPQTFKARHSKYHLAMRLLNRRLTLLFTTKASRFHLVLDQQDLPEQAQLCLGSPALLFDLLKDQHNFEFDSQLGELTIHMAICIGTKRVPRTASILLKKSEKKVQPRVEKGKERQESEKNDKEKEKEKEKKERERERERERSENKEKMEKENIRKEKEKGEEVGQSFGDKVLEGFIQVVGKQNQAMEVINEKLGHMVELLTLKKNLELQKNREGQKVQASLQTRREIALKVEPTAANVSLGFSSGRG